MILAALAVFVMSVQSGLMQGVRGPELWGWFLFAAHKLLRKDASGTRKPRDSRGWWEWQGFGRTGGAEEMYHTNYTFVIHQFLWRV